MVEISRTFSELWYRVADFSPRLSPHLNVRRHTYRKETWFVLGDPASSKFYRFNAPAFRFLGLLDGKRTVLEAWDVCNAQLGDDAPTQKDCIDLLCQLQMFGLLRGDLPIDAPRLRERFDLIRERKFQERTGKFVFWTVPLINPEPILAKFANVARVVFSAYGMVALIVLLFFALRAVLPRMDDLASSFNGIIAPQNLFWLSICFLGLKVIHEFAHGFACKAYGGRVTDIGLFFMIVLPIPYCDATASWAFPSKWNRILVSSAGVMVELAVASVAAIIWANTPQGYLIHSLCYNVMIIASFASVLFNLNPLLRYDGYYILSDLLEIPNLATRSHELLKWQTRRYLFGLKGEPIPSLNSIGEGAWMMLHAICAFPYRLLIMFGIVLLVADRYFVFGLLLAIFGGIVWFIVPIIKGLTYVVTEPTLEVVRIRAVTVTFSLVAAVVLLVGFVPMPARVYSIAVVEPEQRFTLRVPNDGFLTELHATNNERVDANQIMFVMTNPYLHNQLAQAQSKLEAGRLQRDAALAHSPSAYQYAETLVDTAEHYYSLSQDMVDDMTIRAPCSGRLISPDIEVKQGTYFIRGTPLGTIVSENQYRIRTYIDDSDNRWLFDDEVIDQLTIEARLFDRPETVIPLMITERIPAGQRSIGHPSLGITTEGGTIPVDPNDQKGQRTLTPQWMLVLQPELTFDQTDITFLPGTRASVRFSLEPEPLLKQWSRIIIQAVRKRFEI